MILSTLRLIETSGYDSYVYTRAKNIECSNEDYNNTELVINTLIYHTIKIYTQVKGSKRNKFNKTKKALFLEKLPVEFNRAKGMELASFIGIKEKTAENYIVKFIASGNIERVEHNHYKKMI